MTSSAVEIALRRADGGGRPGGRWLAGLRVALVAAPLSAAAALAGSGPAGARVAGALTVAALTLVLVYLADGLQANVYSSGGELMRALGTASVAGAIGVAALDRLWGEPFSLVHAAAVAAAIMLSGGVVARTALIPACRTARPRALLLVEADAGPAGPECERLGRRVQVVGRIAVPASPEEVAAQIGLHRPALVLVESGASAIEFGLVRLCSQESIRLLVLIRPPYGLAMGRAVVRLAGLPWVAFAPLALAPRHVRAKRALDLVVVALAAPVVLPLMAAISLAITATSRGGALYRQRRVGASGRPFVLLKFRTMRADAERDTGPVLAEHGDPRVTRVGGFLRRLRLDELPQLWNVVRGEMSLVGPRPERPELAAAFGSIAGYQDRLLLRPGMTGLAQLVGGYSSSPADKLRCDLLYLSTRSLRLDLRLLGATALHFLRGFPDA